MFIRISVFLKEFSYNKNTLMRNNMYLKLQKYLGLDLNYFIVGGFWATISLVVATLSGIIISSLFAQYWPEDVYGRYSFLMTIIGFLSLIALPGMSQAVTQAAAEKRDSFFWIAYRIVFKYSLIGTFLLTLGSIYFHLRGNSPLSYLTLLCAFIFPLISTGNLYIANLNGRGKFDKAALYTVIGQFISLTITAAALIISGSLIIVSFLSLLSLSVVNLVLTFVTIKKSPIKQERHQDLVKLGVHQSFSQLFTISADYFDRILVAFLLGFSQNAAYAFALIFPMQIHNILKTFLTLGQPKIAGIDQKVLNKTLIKKSLQLELVVILVITFYILLAPQIFNILYPKYQNSIFISQIFALSLLYFPSNLLALNLIKLRKNKQVYLINISYNILTLITLLVFLPIFGLLGAALSKIISRLGYSLVIFYYFNKARKED